MPALSPTARPYDFLPTTTAALVALVASKADDKTFAIVVTTPTQRRFSGYAPTWGDAQWPAPLTFPPHAALLVAPVGPASARLYTYRVTYRQRRQGGELCAGVEQDAIARGMLAQQAIDWMNALDLRYPVAPTPNPTPDVAGLAVDARGHIVGKLHGYTKPWAG